MLYHLLALIIFNTEECRPTNSSNPSGGGLRFLLVLIAGILGVVSPKTGAMLW